MSEIHARLFWVAENVYLGASGAFQSEQFYRAEILALGVVGMVTFLKDDNDTPVDLRSRAAGLRKTALALAAQARSAWFDRKMGPSLSGASRVVDQFRRQLDETTEEMDDIAKNCLAEWH
jgi:hypothetical protein